MTIFEARRTKRLTTSSCNSATPVYWVSPHSLLVLQVHPPAHSLARLGLLWILLRDIEEQALRIEHDPVLAVAEDACDIPRRLEFPELQESFALLHCLSNELGALGFTLCSYDRGVLLLQGLVDEESCSKRSLLCDLLGLDGVCKFGGEGDVCEGDVV